MGSVGNRPVQNQKTLSTRISEFFEELQNRDYGTHKPGAKISEERSKEFRRVYAEMINTVSRMDNPDQPVVFASGFRYGATDPDKYIHTIQKLNQYQRILQSEVRGTAVDLRLGVIDENRAETELRALKNIDRMIAQRKKELKSSLEDFIK